MLAIPRDLLRFIGLGTPFGALAYDYLSALLSRERSQALDLIVSAVDSGTTVEDIYLHVFQPVQYEVGALWESGSISVGHEHYCTNVTQLAMATLYPRIFSGKRSGKRVVGACVQGELHELGLRMVCDGFAMRGWDSDFLGSSTPPEGLLRFLEETPVDLLAVGVTMPVHLDEAEHLIRAVRASKLAEGTLILVGGYAVGAADTLWQDLGADGTASNAGEAMSVAERLGAGRSP